MLFCWGKSCTQFFPQRTLECVDAILSFDDHIKSISPSCLSSLCQINRVKRLLDTLFNVANALVLNSTTVPLFGRVQQKKISINYSMFKISQLGS